MKKILQVTGSLRLGGLETVVSNYVKYGSSSNIEYTYLVYGEKIGFYENIVTQLGGKVIHITSPKKIYKYFKELNSIFNQYGPFDVVHAHTSFNSAFALKLAKKKGVSIRIAHSHTDRRKVPISLVHKLYNKIMNNIIRRNGNTFIACSNNAGEYLFGKNFFEENGQVILNGIDNSRFNFNFKKRDSIRKAYNIKHEILLGHVGTFNDVKNQRFLIDTVMLLNATERKYKLMLVGDGPTYSELKKYVEDNNMNEDIIFIGEKSNAEDYLMAMDIFLFPSKFEGLGLVAVEAQIADLPVIISSNVPNEVIATENCYQLPLDLKKWSEKIKTIQIKSDRKKMFLKEFDIYNVVRKTEELYE